MIYYCFFIFSSVSALLHYLFLYCLNLKGSGVATPPPLFWIRQSPLLKITLNAKHSLDSYDNDLVVFFFKMDCQLITQRHTNSRYYVMSNRKLVTVFAAVSDVILPRMRKVGCANPGRDSPKSLNR